MTAYLKLALCIFLAVSAKIDAVQAKTSIARNTESLEDSTTEALSVSSRIRYYGESLDWTDWRFLVLLGLWTPLVIGAIVLKFYLWKHAPHLRGGAINRTMQGTGQQIKSLKLNSLSFWLVFGGRILPNIVMLGASVLAMFLVRNNVSLIWQEVFLAFFTHVTSFVCLLILTTKIDKIIKMDRYILLRMFLGYTAVDFFRLNTLALFTYIFSEGGRHYPSLAESIGSSVISAVGSLVTGHMAMVYFVFNYMASWHYWVLVVVLGAGMAGLWFLGGQTLFTDTMENACTAEMSSLELSVLTCPDIKRLEFVGGCYSLCSEKRVSDTMKTKLCDVIREKGCFDSGKIGATIGLSFAPLIGGAIGSIALTKLYATVFSDRYLKATAHNALKSLNAPGASSVSAPVSGNPTPQTQSSSKAGDWTNASLAKPDIASPTSTRAIDIDSDDTENSDDLPRYDPAVPVQK